MLATPPRIVTAVVVAAIAAVAFAPWAVAEEPPHRALLTLADALVNVQFVLKVKTEGGESNDFEDQITCPLIDPQGLILCANTELGGYVTQMSRLAGGGSITASPSDLTVILPGSTEGVKAQLLVRDTERDLAWIRIEEAPASPLAYLDFAHNAMPQVGDRFFTLHRLDKFFDALPIVHDGTIGAIVKKPRRLLVPSGSPIIGFGVPAFTADGHLIGVTVLQMPASRDEGTSFNNPYSVVSTTLSMQQMLGGLILPAEEIVEATRLALELEDAEDSEDAEDAEDSEDSEDSGR
jgi:hypothetical protein